MDERPAVELHGITKRYPGVIANENIELAVSAGEVHAIVGENGAGKSTLMNILYGMVIPDEGTILVHGEVQQFRSPKDAIDLGIGMVHQHFMLADNLSVLENIILGSEPKSGLEIDFDAAHSKIAQLAESYKLHLEPDALVEGLSVGVRQRVEIIKVLYRGAEILILDEPTAVLVPQEVDELFASIRDLQDKGVTVLFISHKLDEVLEIADKITVIRGGKTVATVRAEDVDAKQLAELMIGSELPTPETGDSTVTEDVALSVIDVGVRDGDGRSLLSEISFDIHRGEIVGVAGVEGNGQAQLVDALLGIIPISQGTVLLDGDDIAAWPSRRRREDGIGLIPEDRHHQGLLLPSPLWENAALGHQTVVPYASGIWIDRKGARAETDRIVDIYGVKTPSVDVPATALSGGNQQKIVVGREILAKPKVLVASQPTRGIDIGAQAAVWEELKAARAAGMGILLLSADLDELIGLSDTMYVIFGGRFVAQLDPAEITPEILGVHMTGSGLEEAS